jgi:HprK-related kinase A
MATRVGERQLHIPPFRVKVRSPLAEVLRHLEFFYSEAREEAPDRFIDFEVEIVPGFGARRFWRRQARFLVEGVEPFFPLPLVHAAPMFEWGLNWCVASRPLGYLLIHAAVVERGGRALLMPGFPGAGKSTLCAALTHLAEWRLLSDELAILDPGDGLLRPHPRPISLKNASIGIVANFPAARIGRTYTDTRKGTIAHAACPRGSLSRADEPAAPRWLVFPKFEPGTALKLEPVSRAQAFAWIAEHSFNNERMGDAGFQSLCELLGACDCNELVYGSTEDALVGIAQICGA